QRPAGISLGLVREPKLAEAGAAGPGNDHFAGAMTAGHTREFDAYCHFRLRRPRPHPPAAIHKNPTRAPDVSLFDTSGGTLADSPPRADAFRRPGDPSRPDRRPSDRLACRSPRSVRAR